MSEFLDSFIKKNKPQFSKYKKYIENNDWTTYKNISDKDNLQAEKDVIKRKSEEYKLQNDLVQYVLNRLSDFVKKTQGEHNTPKFKTFTKFCLSITSLHTSRVEDYLTSIDITKIENQDVRSEEIKLTKDCHSGSNKIEESVKQLNIKEEQATEGIQFYNDQKATIAMHDTLVNLYPEIKVKLDSMKIDFDSPPPPTIHILNPNPPKYNPNKHYWEQEKETLQYYVDEYKKIERGVEVGGYYFDGWLYFHFNHFVTTVPRTVMVNGISENKDETRVPPLRDNEILITNYFIKSKKEKTLSFISATRRAAKTTMNSSRIVRAQILNKKQILCAGGSAEDLNHIQNNIYTHHSNVNPAFKLYYLSKTEDGRGSAYGIKDGANKSKITSNIYIINLEGGTASKKKETLAGFTPDEFILDEAMKFPFKKQLEALESALWADGIRRCPVLLTGCVCAGTKVYNNVGNLVNIEDLNPYMGIIGFDCKEETCVTQDITYIQPPANKPCYRITTSSGRYLECSNDHPILTTSDKEDTSKGRRKRFRKMFYKHAEDISIGDNFVLPREIPLNGVNMMWQPRFVGMLIGDGSYGKDKTPVFSNCDPELINYVESNFDTVTETERLTKEGKTYKEIRVRNITKNLRDLGIYTQTKNKKTLPQNIHLYREEDIRELIGGLVDTDGCVYYNGKTGRIFLAFSGINLIREVQHLLHRLGINSRIQECPPNPKNPKDKNPYYKLEVLDNESIKVFYQKIKLLVKYKQEKLEKLYELIKDKKNLSIQKNYPNVRTDRVTSIEFIGEKPIYNLTASNTHTYIANGIITHNTGGSTDLAVDAIKMLNNPRDYKVTLMDWEDLERGIPEHLITWKHCDYGLFLPTQTCTKHRKIKTNLATYLGIESETLSQVEILVTDWETSKKSEEEERKSKEKDKEAYTKLLAYHPFDPEEIFLSGEINRFPVEALKRRKRHLEETGQTGKKVVLYQGKDGTISYDLSNKDVVKYRDQKAGGFHDAPVILYTELPEVTPPAYLYVAGFDDYKQDQSGTDSVGSFHIYKVNIGMDKWCGRIVASIASRPDPHENLHKQIFLLMKAFNAKCFMENVDDKFKTFLERKRVADLWLQTSLDFKADMAQQSTGRRKYGWTPTPANINFLTNLAVHYANEDISYENEDGEMIEMLGCERIDDVELLQEMIDYKKDRNCDRITSFMSCLGMEFYLDCNFMLPTAKNFKKKEEDEKKKQKPIQNLATRMYGTRSRGRMF